MATTDPDQALDGDAPAHELAGFPAAFQRFAGGVSFNNAGILSATPNTNAFALRGLVIGTIILGLGIAIFAVVSNNGHIRTPKFVDDIAEMMSSPAPAPTVRKAKEPDAAQMQVANPGAGGGLPSGGTPLDAFPPIVTPLHDGPVPKTAAQALHEVLRHYRNDPKRTATVTISSSGRIVETTPGRLTAHDGLPVEALDGSTEIGGSSPAPAGPPAP